MLCSVWIIAFASILIKMADAPALAIAAWRMGLATLILSPWMLLRSRGRGDDVSSHRLWLLASGAALALHFASWILSLKYTSVASSVVLVTAHPIFVALGSHFFLREKLARGLGMGIVLSVLGGALIGYGDFRVSGQALWGDFLALVGALGAAVYFLIGRRVRVHLDLGRYIYLVYGTAAILLIGFALATSCPLTGFSARTYAMLVLLAIGPQLVGHTTFNWALRYVSAPMVSVATLVEPIGAAILAYWLLNETVTGLTLMGGVLILAGVYLAMRAEEKHRRNVARP